MSTDATSDVESVATDMSDEFMVVPVPPCFDPDAPLTADPSPVTVSVTEYKQMTESQQGTFSFTLSDQPTLKTELKSVPGTSSFIDRRSVSTDDTSMETISRTTVEEDNNVFEPLNDSNLQKVRFMRCTGFDCFYGDWISHCNRLGHQFAGPDLSKEFLPLRAN